MSPALFLYLLGSFLIGYAVGHHEGGREARKLIDEMEYLPPRTLDLRDAHAANEAEDLARREDPRDVADRSYPRV